MTKEITSLSNETSNLAKEVSLEIPIPYEIAETFVIDSFRNGVYDKDEIESKIYETIARNGRFA